MCVKPLTPFNCTQTPGFSAAHITEAFDALQNVVQSNTCITTVVEVDVNLYF